MFHRLLMLVGLVTVLFLAGCDLYIPGITSTNPGISGSGLTLVAGSDSDYHNHGGQQFVLVATCASDDSACTLTTTRLTQTLKMLIVRLNASADHISDAYFKTQPTANNAAVRIMVHVPGKHDASQLATLLTQPGVIQFIETNTTALAVGTRIKPGSYPVLFTNADLDPNAIGVTYDAAGQPNVTFEMLGAARQRFADYTQQHIADYLTIVLDNVVVESATIQSEITGQGQISGNFTKSEAQRVANLLKTEPLPLVLQVAS